MKKKKRLGIVLQLATICLCVCAIAIGVYSVKNASLSVTGTVGFEAHDCKVDVVVNINGDAVADDGVTPDLQGTKIRTTKKENFATATINGANASLELPNFYFSDMTQDGEVGNITLEFVFTNKSDFDVDSSITSTSATGVNITADKQSTILANKNVSDDTNTNSIVFTLAYNAETFNGSTPIEINIKFNKHQDAIKVVEVTSGLVGEQKFVIRDNVGEVADVLCNDDDATKLYEKIVDFNNSTEELHQKYVNALTADFNVDIYDEIKDTNNNIITDITSYTPASNNFSVAYISEGDKITFDIQYEITCKLNCVLESGKTKDDLMIFVIDKDVAKVSFVPITNYDASSNVIELTLPYLGYILLISK